MHKACDLFKNNKRIPADSLIVGMDMARHKCFAVAITERAEYISKPIEFYITKVSLEKLYRQMKKLKREAGCKGIASGMESTGAFCKPVISFFEKKGVQVKFVNTNHVKKSKEMFDNCPSKNDPKDAYIIARLLDEGKFLDMMLPTDARKNIQLLCPLRDSYVKDRVSHQNRLHGVLGEYSPEYTGLFSELTGKTSLAVLEAAPLPCDILSLEEDKLIEVVKTNSCGRLGRERAMELIESARDSLGCTNGLESARYCIRELVGRIKYLNAKVKEIENRLEEILESLDAYHILNSIPGISLVTIAWTIATVGDMGSFDSSRAVLKYLGLNLYEISSGAHRGKRRLSKRGPSKIRGVLYLGILNMVKGGGIFEEKHRDFLRRGKPGPVSIVALECKLVRTMFALLRDKTTYNPSYTEAGAEKTTHTQLCEEAA